MIDHPASSLSDYQALRQAGIVCLQQLAAPEWTDFNAHDPGITILEQFCYALTELAYRCDFSLPDLLSSDGRKPYASLFSPAQVLTSRPVTLLDLRKLAVDVRGVKNAWIEKVGGATPQAFYLRGGSVLHARHEGLVQLQPGEGAEPIALKGLFRVLVETSDVLGIDGPEVIRNVASRLHAQRPLCMDFASVEILPPQLVRVRATIEIGPLGSPEDTLVAIVGKIANHLSPTMAFHTVAQRLAAGKRVDQIFDGPMLTQGFIDNDELIGMKRRTALRVSDLIREIMRAEGVLIVKHLSLSGDNGLHWQDWWLDLAADRAPVFDLENSELNLERQQIRVDVDRRRVIDRHQAARASQDYRPARPQDLDIQPPSGRDRSVARYHSAQHHFPEVYGLGQSGLPQHADALRRAQLRQLQAYLLLFDQLLANQFAQLAHLGDLLGFDNDRQQTYFAGDTDDSTLRLDDVWQQPDAAARHHRLSQLVENPQTPADDPKPQVDWSRRNRFLDHLLARFAEQLTDHAQFRPDSVLPLAAAQERLARDKQSWLRRYPRLGADRGTGFNTLRPCNEQPAAASASWELDNCSGLEQRLRLKLGLRPGVPEERFFLVEHVLLRPLDADDGPELPLLADARCPDPYSLQVSLVFADSPTRFPVDGAFRRFVEQTVREETPVHLLVYLRWLDEPGALAFEAAYRTWMEDQRTLREWRGNDQKALHLPRTSNDRLRLGLRLRDARDRLIDLLQIAHTYPLANLPVVYPDMVAWGQKGDITLISSQEGVAYELLDKNGAPLDPRVEAAGSGGDCRLLTPVISKDISFLISATKAHRDQLSVTAASDGQVLIPGSRLDSRYELCTGDGQPFDPPIVAPGGGGDLRLSPPAGVHGTRFMVQVVKTLTVVLSQSIDIRVGLDTSLQASIVSAELLDPATSGAADPRIVDYGESPQVEILASQASVDYRLVRIVTGPAGADYQIVGPESGNPVYLETVSTGSVRGGPASVFLPTQPMLEDTDLHVLAIKTFEASENQKEQRALLKVTLPLKVRANPALTVTVPQPLLDYGADARVVVKATQESVSYQVFTRRIVDNATSEFVRDDADSSALKIADMASLAVRNPPNPTADATAVGEAITGNGGDLVLTISALREDSVVVVYASKRHATTGALPAIPSRLQLTQAVAVLVRPGTGAEFPLRLRAQDGGASAPDALHQGTVYSVLGGQPGVFYHFRLAGSESDLGLPVYVHKAGKGIGDLQVGIDFTVAGTLPTPPPEWDCPVDLDATARLSIRAVKAQTGLETVFERGVDALLGAS